jgi:hypothetical protein
MGTKYPGKMVNTHHIHYRMPLFEADQTVLHEAGPVQLELELIMQNSSELNDHDEQKMGGSVWNGGTDIIAS